MRFNYVALAVAATILATTNAVTTDAELTQISKTGPIENGAKRSLRAYKTAFEEEEAFDGTEERGGQGYTVKALLGKANINFDIVEKLGENKAEKLVKRLINQNRNQKELLDYLGEKNFALYEKVKHRFTEAVV
ncbi:putative secreted RxLR effector protein [Phytophthora cinnamomi]|uniref:putative secreted RxLR effector protein n=1 Tax=Phytophthora cinnamomi TaxID=4785 RepID=UPI002A2A6AB0|nr:putative secreted RxLR effector protein [Phytophthora cinnamomi]KAJ8578041.1 hypothetical protein ON010_g1164 [Phytophthora cinnamomi]